MEPSLGERVRSLFSATQPATADVVEVTQLPPATDGRTYRYEVVVRLPDSTDEAPDEDTVRMIGDEVLAATDDLDIPEEAMPDEVYVQIYAPDRDTDAGACGTAHWLADGGYESVESRPYMF